MSPLRLIAVGLVTASMAFSAQAASAATITPNVWPAGAGYGPDFNVTVTGIGNPGTGADVELRDTIQATDLYADGAAFFGYEPTLLDMLPRNATYIGPIEVQSSALDGLHTIQILNGSNVVGTVQVTITGGKAGTTGERAAAKKKCHKKTGKKKHKCLKKANKLPL